MYAMEPFHTSLFWPDEDHKVGFHESTLETPCGPELTDFYENVDPGLLALAIQAEQGGVMTPLIKEELKMKIQTKRLKKGLSELKVDKNIQKVEELTQDDLIKREVRKEQNRRAARKYRNKQKTRTSSTSEEVHELESMNVTLRNEIWKLTSEKMRLENILQSHLGVCQGLAIMP